MRIKNKIVLISAVFLIIVILTEFFFISPIGIKIGYMLNGGHKTAEQGNRRMPSEIRRDYEDMVETYYLYKNEENSTAKKWAETARIKANSLAREYNALVNEYILEEIGE